MKDHPLPRETVDVGSLTNLVSITAQRLGRLVVGQNEEKVGSTVVRRGALANNQRKRAYGDDFTVRSHLVHQFMAMIRMILLRVLSEIPA